MLSKGIGLPLSATLAIQAFVSMAAYTVPIFAPTAAEEIGIPATAAGVYVSLTYAASMLSSLWSVDFIVRFGALRVSQACLVLCALGLSLTAAASLPACVLSALVLGLGYGPTTPASSHVLSRSTPAHLMSLIFSIKQTGVPLGGSLAGAIVPALVLSGGWKIAAMTVGALCVLTALLLEPIRAGIDVNREPARPISFRGATGPLRQVMSHRPLRRLVIMSFVYSGMQMCLVTYLVIYLTGNIGMTLVAAGLTLSAAQIAGAVGRIIWGVIADRFLRPPLVLGLIGVTMSVGAAATASFSPAWPYAAVWIFTALFGASAIGWNGVYLAEVARLAPAARVSAATGGSLFFTFLGVVAGPPFFAVVVTISASYSLAYALFAVFTLVCALVITFSGDRHARA